jgi:riboflavin kinase / FMN adenylyltransferase
LKVYKSLQEFTPLEKAVVTTGTFDGLHIGHQKIINTLQTVASAIDGETVIITFHPHPRLVLFPDDNDLKLLTTLDEKIQLLEKAGINHLIIIPFDKNFSRLTSLEFVRDILINTIGTKKLVIGYDHHFGRNREGNFESLKELAPLYNFDVEEIPAQDINHVAVSSSKIRTALLEGDVATAKEYLSYSYKLTGVVVQGNQLGRTIGYPTANIVVDDKYKLIPANGVYAVNVFFGKEKFGGMMNIGVRPTVNGTSRTIEVNIFDFSDDIYNQQITVEFVAHIRTEQKFAGLDALKNQLKTDKDVAQKLLL